MKLLAPLASFAAMAAVVGLSLGTVTSSKARAASEAYTIDLAHSYMVFRIKHMDVAWAYGRFNKFSGTVNLDEANPAACSVNVEVETASVDTGIGKRDDHLRTPDYLNVAQFPKMTFQSTSVKKTGEGQFEVTGNLMFHGQTKVVTAKFEKTGMGKDRAGKPLVGFEGTFTIKRSDFGQKVDPKALGDDVRVTLSIEAVRG
jgi:polyisoprenoid-binding protein YceI